MILGEVKARPKDIISFSLDYISKNISKSKVQTSNPSSSPTPLDTPARPADFDDSYHLHHIRSYGPNMRRKIIGCRSLSNGSVMCWGVV